MSNEIVEQLIAAPLGYTVSEFAEMFKLSRAQAYAYVEAGQLPAIRFGRKVFIKRETVEDILSGNLTFKKIR